MVLQEYKTRKLFEVRAYKFKELCAMYKVSPKTLRKWLMNIEVKISLDGGYYKIPQVEIIIEKMGFPYVIYELDQDKAERKELKKPFEVRPYKFKELALLYEINPKTLRKWLHPFRDEIGLLNGGYYQIPQVEIIIHHIGIPYLIGKGDEEEEEESKKKPSRAA